MIEANEIWVKFPIPLEFYFPGDPIHRAATGEEISLQGLTLLTGTPLYLDMEIVLKIRFPLPGTVDDFLDQDPLVVRSHVLYTRMLGTLEDQVSWEVGLRFSQLEGNERRRIQDYVDREVRSEALRSASGPYDGFLITACLKRHILECEECRRVYGEYWPHLLGKSLDAKETDAD